MERGGGEEWENERKGKGELDRITWRRVYNFFQSHFSKWPISILTLLTFYLKDEYITFCFNKACYIAFTLPLYSIHMLSHNRRSHSMLLVAPCACCSHGTPPVLSPQTFCASLLVFVSLLIGHINGFLFSLFLSLLFSKVGILGIALS